MGRQEPFRVRLERCADIGEVFALAKEIASSHLQKEQAGLLVGLADLGAGPHGFVGAYYAPHSNIIILNRRMLERVKRDQQELYLPYLFHLLLHEYIHSLGVYDEAMTRRLTHEISKTLDHKTIEELATDMAKFFPDMIYSPIKEPPAGLDVEFIMGIDRKNTDYIL